MKLSVIVLAVLAVVAVLLPSVGAQSAEHAGEGFHPLFDGKTLQGWHALGGGTWTVEGGVIAGRGKSSERRHGHLFTADQYADFTVRLKFKNLAGNSGLYFRVQKTAGDIGIKGFQAEIDARKDVGGLYETSGRGWVVQPKPEDVKQYFKPDDWNTMTVTARGRNVTVYVNGTKTAQVKNDQGRLSGFIALQLHGGQDMEVYFKDIEIKGAPMARPPKQ